MQRFDRVVVGIMLVLVAAVGMVAAIGGRSAPTQTPRNPEVLYMAPADARERSLYAVPLEGGEPRKVFEPPDGVFDFVPAPDGSRIAVVAYNSDQSLDIWLVRRDGGGAQRITDCGPGSCSAPAWSPDGLQIAYERHDMTEQGLAAGRVWLYDVQSSRAAPVFEDPQVRGAAPQWSADGSRLAFYDTGARAIRVLEVATGTSTLIPSEMGETGSLAPDGSALVYADIRVVGRQFYPELWLADLGAGGGLAPLLEAAEEDQTPVWSPDGRWIAFARRLLDRTQGMGSQLMLYDVETGALEQITGDTAYNNTRFSWDAAGRSLLVQRFDLSSGAAEAEIWHYDLQTGSLTRLVDNGFGAQWLNQRNWRRDE